MKPIIFNTEIVRAILDGRKTHTRRSITVYEKCVIENTYKKDGYLFVEFDGRVTKKSPYKVGDIIYVRETFSEWLDYDTRSLSRVTYKASDEDCSGKWKPSIHMPKEYARLFLRVKDVRIERLNEISRKDAMREGIEQFKEDDGLIWFRNYLTPRIGLLGSIESFASLWESIYGNGSFDNRYVWVIEFEQININDAEVCDE